jgi:hypothetical protein
MKQAEGTKKIKLLLVSAFALFQWACSQHTIDADLDIDSKQVREDLSNVVAQSSSQDGTSTGFSNLALEETTAIYYGHYGPDGSLGSVNSGLAFNDLSFLGQNLFIEDIEHVYIYFLDNNTTAGREMALMIKVQPFQDKGNPVIVIFAQTGNIEIEGDTLFVTLTDGQNTLYASTDELADGVTDLAPAIQLHFEADLGFGLEPIGKISTLVGLDFE